VIAQFYSTLWVTKANKQERTPAYLNFLIQGVPYRCSYFKFAKILGFGDDDLRKDHFHNIQFGEEFDASVFHIDTSQHMWETSNMKPYYRYLNLLFCQTILPKAGNEMNVQSNSQLLLSFFTPKEEQEFSIFDLLWREILSISWDYKKSLAFAPFIMKMIEVVTKYHFEKTVEHVAYVPKLIKLNIAPPAGVGTSRSRAPQSPQTSGELDPPLPRHESSSRAARASRPMAHTSGSGGRRGSGSSFLRRGLNALFHMCRANRNDILDTRREQHEFQDRMLRQLSSMSRQPVDPMPPYQDHVRPADNLDEYHRQVFGYDIEEEQGDHEEQQEVPPQQDAQHQASPLDPSVLPPSFTQVPSSQQAQDEEAWGASIFGYDPSHESYQGPYPYHNYMPPAAHPNPTTYQGPSWDDWTAQSGSPSSHRGGPNEDCAFLVTCCQKGENEQWT
jgi:hypothetical protein